MATFDITAVLKAQDQASGQLSKVGQSTDKLGGKFQKLGKTASIAAGFIAASLVAGAGAAITNFVKGGIDEFLKMEDAMLILKAAVESQGGDWEELEDTVVSTLEDMELKTGVAADELAASMSKLLRAGVPQEDVDAFLLGIVGTARDVGRDLATVTDTFADAIATGSIASLQKFGVDLIDIAVEAGTKFAELDLAAPLRELAESQPDLAADLEAGFDGSEESARDLVRALLDLGVEIPGLSVDFLAFAAAVLESREDLAILGDSLSEQIKRQQAELRQAQRELGAASAPFQLMWINFVSGFLEDVPKLQKDWKEFNEFFVGGAQDMLEGTLIIMGKIGNEFNKMVEGLIDSATKLWKSLIGGSIWTDTFEGMADIEKRSLGTITRDVENKMPVIAAGAAAISGAVQSVSIHGPLTTIQGNASGGDLERANRIAIRQITRGVRQ